MGNIKRNGLADRIIREPQICIKNTIKTKSVIKATNDRVPPVSLASLVSPRFSILFQGVGPRGVRQKGGLFVTQGHPAVESEAVRQTQGTEVPGPAYNRLLSRDGAQPRLHKRGIDGNFADERGRRYSRLIKT